MDQLPKISVQIASAKPVQSADVGESPRVRRKKFKEVQGIRKEIKVHMDKLSQGLRP